MNRDAVILIAEDDQGHFELIKRNLWRSCVENEILHFKDGQEVMDFLFRKGNGLQREKNRPYLLLLDIRMPKVDGYEVLRQIKSDDKLSVIPVIVVTTTDDQSEIDRCAALGSNFYMVKPADYTKFMEAVENLGAFLSLDSIMVPPVTD